MNGYTLLQRSAWRIPNIDVTLTEYDLAFLKQCGITPEIEADWRPEVPCHL